MQISLSDLVLDQDAIDRLASGDTYFGPRTPFTDWQQATSNLARESEEEVAKRAIELYNEVDPGRGRAMGGSTADLAFREVVQEPAAASWMEVYEREGLSPYKLDPETGEKFYINTPPGVNLVDLLEGEDKQEYLDLLQKQDFEVRASDRTYNVDTGVGGVGAGDYGTVIRPPEVSGADRFTAVAAPILASAMLGPLAGTLGVPAALQPSVTGALTAAATGGDPLTAAITGGLGSIAEPVIAGADLGTLGTAGVEGLTAAGIAELTGGDPLTAGLTAAGTSLGKDLLASAAPVVEEPVAADTVIDISADPTRVYSGVDDLGRPYTYNLQDYIDNQKFQDQVASIEVPEIPDLNDLSLYSDLEAPIVRDPYLGGRPPASLPTEDFITYGLGDSLVYRPSSDTSGLLTSNRFLEEAPVVSITEDPELTTVGDYSQLYPDLVTTPRPPELISEPEVDLTPPELELPDVVSPLDFQFVPPTLDIAPPPVRPPEPIRLPTSVAGGGGGAAGGLLSGGSVTNAVLTGDFSSLGPQAPAPEPTPEPVAVEAPVEPVELTDIFTDTVEAIDTTAPLEPVEPVEAVEPVEPVEPVEAVEAVEPVDTTPFAEADLVQAREEGLVEGQEGLAEAIEKSNQLTETLESTRQDLAEQRDVTEALQSDIDGLNESVTGLQGTVENLQGKLSEAQEAREAAVQQGNQQLAESITKYEGLLETQIANSNEILANAVEAGNTKVDEAVAAGKAAVDEAVAAGQALGEAKYGEGKGQGAGAGLGAGLGLGLLAGMGTGTGGGVGTGFTPKDFEDYQFRKTYEAPELVDLLRPAQGYQAPPTYNPQANYAQTIADEIRNLTSFPALSQDQVQNRLGLFNDALLQEAVMQNLYGAGGR